MGEQHSFTAWQLYEVFLSFSMVVSLFNVQQRKMNPGALQCCITSYQRLIYFVREDDLQGFELGTCHI
jgi:prolipoprotein diacylglyceryltransferase